MSDIPTEQSVTEASALLYCSFQPCSEEENLHKCRKCERLYCVMHANLFSPNFCKECFKSLQAIESKFTRTFEDYDTRTGQLSVRKESHTKYYMDGMDWPFLGLWINRLSDDELKSWWIFHFSIMKLIEAENEVRKVKRTKVLREQSVGLITGTKKLSTGTVKTTKMPDTAEDVRKKLKKQNIPDAIIDQMIKAMNI